MSTRKPKTPPTAAADRATAIADKVSEQVKTLICRNWTEIQDILTDEHTAKLSFGVTLKEEYGDDKASGLDTSISFSLKFKDSVSSPLPDPAQGTLPIEDKPKEPAEPNIEA